MGEEIKILGIDCGGTYIKIGLVNTKGQILIKEKIKTPHQSLKDFIKTFYYIIDKYKDEIKGIGIAFAGPLDPKEGIIKNPPNFPSYIHNFPFIKELKEVYPNLTILLENDANLAALGEYWQGKGKNTNILVVITLGTGVGGGIIINGKIWNGASGIAGEIGHLYVGEGEVICGCGRKGCLESFVSSTAIVKHVEILLKNTNIKTKLREVKKEELTSEIVYKLAKENDELAIKIYEKVGIYLARGIRAISHILAPEKIIFTGGGSKAWDVFSPFLKRELELSLFKEELKSMKILTSSLYEEAGILGASYLVLQNIYI